MDNFTIAKGKFTCMLWVNETKLANQDVAPQIELITDEPGISGYSVMPTRSLTDIANELIA